ncbi:MAG: PRC-barrel domain-containing protein [Gammaproteobacteria bacterium]
MNNLIKTKDVIGVKVCNLQNEDIGKIEEIVLDKLSGEVRFAVLSFGGFLGMGDKHFPLPWHVLNYQPDQEAFVVNLDKEFLKNAPSFEKNSWPDFSEGLWDRNIIDYYRDVKLKKAA